MRLTLQPSPPALPSQCSGLHIHPTYVCVCTHVCSVVSNSAAAWTVAHQAPLSMGFSRHEYWSGLPFPSPGDLPHPGIKPAPPTLAGGFFTAEPPGKPHIHPNYTPFLTPKASLLEG